MPSGSRDRTSQTQRSDKLSKKSMRTVSRGVGRRDGPHDRKDGYFPLALVSVRFY